MDKVLALTLLNKILEAVLVIWLLFEPLKEEIIGLEPIYELLLSWA